MVNGLKSLLDFLFPQSTRDKTISNLTPEMLAEKFVLFENDGIFSFFPYEDELIKHMIWKLKYRGDKRMAELFSESIADVFMEELGEHALLNGFENPLLIPIPLSRGRLRERGYNQAHIFARALKEAIPSFGTVTHDVLLKIRETPPQTSLVREKRNINLRGVFLVRNQNAVQGKDALLVDDITTTGSTLREARKTLERAGARSVISLTIAH